MKGGRNGGDKANEGNIKLLRKKEPIKPKRKTLDRHPETKIWSFLCLQCLDTLYKRLANKKRERERLASCSSTVTQSPSGFLSTLSSVMQKLSLQITFQRLLGLLALCEVLPVGSTRGKRKVGSRANGLPAFYYFCTITLASISTWRTSLIMLTHKYDQQLDNDLPLEVSALTHKASSLSP